MKNLLLIFILSLSLSLNAQRWVRPVEIIAYHVGTVAIGAVGDAMYDEGNKEWGHASTVPTVVTKQQTAPWDIGAYVS